jgi:hypothetical protein
VTPQPEMTPRLEAGCRVFSASSPPICDFEMRPPDFRFLADESIAVHPLHRLVLRAAKVSQGLFSCWLGEPPSTPARRREIENQAFDYQALGRGAQQAAKLEQPTSRVFCSGVPTGDFSLLTSAALDWSLQRVRSNRGADG